MRFVILALVFLAAMVLQYRTVSDSRGEPRENTLVAPFNRGVDLVRSETKEPFNEMMDRAEGKPAGKPSPDSKTSKTPPETRTVSGPTPVTEEFGWIQSESKDPKRVRYVAGKGGAPLFSTNWKAFESGCINAIWTLTVQMDKKGTVVKTVHLTTPNLVDFKMKDTNGNWGPITKDAALTHISNALEVAFLPLNGHPVQAEISFVPERKPGSTEEEEFPQPPTPAITK